MAAMVVGRPQIPYFREEPREDLPPAPRPLLVGQLGDDELYRAFRFLRRDYAATIAGTAGLPNVERFEAVRSRLEDYSDALADALGDAVDDAAILVQGRRRIGGRR